MKRDITTRLKKEFDTLIKSVAIKGDENIKNELVKRGQDASISHSIKDNTIEFTVEAKTEKIETEKLPKKEAAKLKKVAMPSSPQL